MASTGAIIGIGGIAPRQADRLLGRISIIMLAMLLVALARGRSHWGDVPWPIWLHLGLLIPALVLTPVILSGRKGDFQHRLLGWIWAVLMIGVALASFLMRPAGGGLSPIWLISLFVLVTVPRLILAARGHRMESHRRIARAIVIGAFLVAGFFTLPFGRMLGQWLFHG